MLFRTKIFTGLSVDNQKKRLLLSLAIFVVALSVPLSILVKIGFEQFQKDVFFFHLWNSKHIIQKTASDMKMHIKVENNRAIDDYHFYKAQKNSGNYKEGATLSPLASIPEKSTIPGLLSYFQVDEDGVFSCPLLPFSSSDENDPSSVNHILSAEEVAQRLLLREEIKPILIEQGFIKKEKEKVEKLPGPGTGILANLSSPPNSENQVYLPGIKKISTFMSKRSRKGFVIFYRKIWNGENKLVQGFVVDEEKFVFDTLREKFLEAEYDTDVMLEVVYKNKHLASMTHEIGRNDTRSIISTEQPQKKIKLGEFELPYSLSDYGIVFSIDRLPIGDSTKTGGIFLAIIIGIIVAGLVVFYRLGIQQINLNDERLNFVSSVSHELKTPLTSIIMYADMLRSGMLTDQAKSKEYYDFIFFEGERLGRLISNVLRLSKLGQDRGDISLEYISLSSAIDIIKSKTSTLTDKNNFTLNIQLGDCVDSPCSILIDRDAFTQVIINLIDNAVKFTAEYLARPDTKDTALGRQIDINVAIGANNDKLKIGIRDYGPGISREDEKHIFKSFYRAGNELTRKTTGTGMGLSLVSELTQAMGGGVEFFNRSPGTEFVVSFQYREEGEVD